MKHSKEPWRICGHARGGCECTQVWSIANDQPVCEMYRPGSYDEIEPPNLETAMANARRVAVCVNFCAGVPNEQLGKTLTQERQQHKALREAVRGAKPVLHWAHEQLTDETDKRLILDLLAAFCGSTALEQHTEDGD